MSVESNDVQTAIGMRHFSLHVFALCGFTIAQPIYDWTSRQPEFLVAHAVDTPAVVLLVLMLSVVVPGALLLLVWSFRLFGMKVLRSAQRFMVGILSGLFVLYLLSSFAVLLAIAIAASMAIVTGFIYWRWSAFRHALTLAALAAVVFPTLFMLSQPVRGMLFSEEHRARIAAGLEDLPTPEEHPEENVVLVILDDLPLATLLDERGEIDELRFPNVARLAATSDWYPLATTVHSSTTWAIPAIASGRFPRTERRPPHWHDFRETLFTWAPSVYGAAVDGHELFTWLCPPAICTRERNYSRIVFMQDVSVLLGHTLLPDQLAARHLPSIHDRWHNFVDQDIDWRFIARLTDRTAQWERFVAGLEAGFQFKHLYLPHSPHSYLPGGTRYRDVLRAEGYHRSTNLGEYYLLHLQRHTAQAQYVDRLLGELMVHLEEMGRWDDTLLVVVADHGADYRPDTSRWRMLEMSNLGEVLNIPIFIKRPQQRDGRIDYYPASLIDIAPTIADVLDRPLPWEVDGTSLVSDERPERSSIEVSCADGGLLVYGCTGKLRRRADEDSVLSVDISEFREIRGASLQWYNRNIAYMPATQFPVPRLSGTEFLGRLLEHTPISLESKGFLKLFGAERFDEVHLESGDLPAMVAGRVEGDVIRLGDVLLVALNGRFWGVAQVAAVDDEETLVFSTLLPREAFIDGQNSIDIYRVAWSDIGLTLTPIDLMEAG